MLYLVKIVQTFSAMGTLERQFEVEAEDKDHAEQVAGVLADNWDYAHIEWSEENLEEMYLHVKESDNVGWA